MTPTEMPARRAVILECLTIAWAGTEAIVAVTCGVAAGSVALVAFGADSAIELMSAGVVVIRLRALVKGTTPNEGREHRDHRTLAVLFFLLAAYVSISAFIALANQDHASRNGVGLVICGSSIVAMPVLSLAKRRSATVLATAGLTSVARLLAADAVETALCAWLGVSTLIGVLLGSWIGWWWADPMAGLVVVLFALREGLEEWRCEIE